MSSVVKFLLWFAIVLVGFLPKGHAQSCCCTNAGANYTILPNLNRHIIGVRYSYKNYVSETQSINPELGTTVTRQQLNSLELFGRFNLKPRLQMSVFVPVHFIGQHSKLATNRTAGLGDMSFLWQYNVLDPLRCTGKKSKHQLRLGAGVKLPSGAFDINATEMFNTNLQLGSGSIDFIFNGIYTYRYNGFGLNASAGYRYNTENTHSYRFGDKVQSAVQVFYLIEHGTLQLMPSVGFNYEHQLENRRNGRKLSYTGGDFLYASVGFDIYYRQFAFSSAFAPALMNNLNWEGENKNRVGFEAGVFYNFSTTKNKTSKYEKE